MRKTPEWVRLPKFCCNKGCRRRPVVARKVNDHWVAMCATHSSYWCDASSGSLDVSKLIQEKPSGGRVLDKPDLVAMRCARDIENLSLSATHIAKKYGLSREYILRSRREDRAA
jgi:hypothetical protein